MRNACGEGDESWRISTTSFLWDDSYEMHS